MSGKHPKRGDGEAARTGPDRARGRKPADRPKAAQPKAAPDATPPDATPPDTAGSKGSFTPPGEVLTTPREGAPDAQVEPQDPERGPAPGEQARRASDAHPSLREDERPLSRGDPGRDAGPVQP